MYIENNDSFTISDGLDDKALRTAAISTGWKSKQIVTHMKSKAYNAGSQTKTTAPFVHLRRKQSFFGS